MSLQQLYGLLAGLIILGLFSYQTIYQSSQKNRVKKFEANVESVNRSVDAGVINLWIKLKDDFSLIEESMRTQSFVGALDIDLQELQKKWERISKADVMCQDSLDIDCRSKVIQELLAVDEQINTLGKKMQHQQLQDRSVAQKLRGYQESLEKVRSQQDRIKDIQQRNQEKTEALRDKNERMLEKNRSKIESLRDKNEAQKDKIQALRDRMERMKKY